MSPWVERHRPKYFSEVKGQDEAIYKIRRFLEEFNSEKSKKAIVLHGSPGIGKTTIAHVIAKETDSELFELNASDFRDKKRLEEILKPAIEQKSLLNKNKIILVDEVDGISSTDRGGLPELLSLIETSTFPILITANDIWDSKLSPLRKKSELIQLKEIDYKTIKDVLIWILRKEKHFIDNEVLTKIAIQAKGDLRAAINDLQTISEMQDSSKVTFDERNKEVDIFNAMKLIFKGRATESTLKLFDSVNMSIDEIILWIEENIPMEYSGKELARAYELLSKTDLFKGRIYKQQYWRFLVYENIFLSYGISSVKKNAKTGFTTYKRPTRILKIWMNNQRTAKKKSIAIKYAEYCHIAQKRAMKEFPIIKQIINSNPSISKELKLDNEELEYLRG
ncbi:MAG TPA: replication factor C large subunit [Candidatus Pacearchaeota archaeon]|nr:replication factor C large subunit [Candidatus Pacearchaeota archaeon]